MENINYNHLYYFWMIAKEGGVTPACKKLSLSQPTISAQLKQFEQSVGKTLFERKARRLVLNDAGKLIFDYADFIFKKGKEMVGALENLSVQNIQVLNVGVLPVLPKKNIHNYLKIPIRDGNTNINLVIHEVAELLDQLSSFQLDMVLSHKAAPTELKNYSSHLLEKVPMLFVASSEYKSLRRKFPAALNNQNVFLPSYATEIRSQIDLYFNKHRITPRIKGEFQDSELLRVVAVSGQGIVAIERSAVSDLIKSKELYIIGDNLDIWQSFYLITAERKEQHVIVKKILKKHRY